MKVTQKILTVAIAMSFSFSAQGQEEEWIANAGLSGIVNTGNAENSTFGGNALVSYKYDRNLFSWTTDGAYGRATDATTGIASTNARNWKTGLRYDRFLSDPLSVFTLGHIGENKPAGFDSRFGAAAGLAYSIFKNDINTLRFEGGYDWTHEERVAAGDADIHSGRLFGQYTHKLNQNVYFAQDIESLFNLVDGDDIRLNSLTSLIIALSEKVGFQVGYQVRFDNVPVAGFKKTDTQTQLGLTVNFL